MNSISYPPRWKTGDAILDGKFSVVFTMPKSQHNWLMSAFLGALSYLSQESTWEEGGESTPYDAATVFEILQQGVRTNVYTIGDTKFSAQRLIRLLTPISTLQLERCLTPAVNHLEHFAYLAWEGVLWSARITARDACQQPTILSAVLVGKANTR
jgi:hypothetical protein